MSCQNLAHAREADPRRLWGLVTSGICEIRFHGLKPVSFRFYVNLRLQFFMMEVSVGLDLAFASAKLRDKGNKPRNALTLASILWTRD